MKKIVKKEVCECKNCGNEAEMVVTCSLPDVDVDEEKITVSDVPKEARDERQAKGTAKCSHCGNEADMWIDY